MARTYEEMSGEMEYEKCVFGQEDDRTVIAILSDKTTVKGKAREGELECGLTYRFYGYWTEHAKYGKQFFFQSFVLAQPSGKRGTVAYLQRGPGIGRKRAELIWDEFGPAALEAIRERPEEVAAKVKGLAEEKAREAATYFQAHVALEATTKDLLELLAGLGTPRNLVEKLIGKWGAKAAELIRDNPYRCMLFRGVGFSKADKLYLQLGGDPAALERLGWCVWNSLHKDRDGHTWRPEEFGRAAIAGSVAGVDAVPQAGIDWAVREHHIVVRENGDGKVWIAEQERAGAEKRLASQVHRAMVEGAGNAGWPDPSALPDLSDHQKEQYALAARGCLAILGGRPGTGKTFTLARILSRISSGRCAVAAPTGKAAVRITESLQKAGVSNMRATTIHSLLGPGRDDDDNWQFEHDELHPLPLDWIFVDEVSMGDCPLLGSLLAARASGCRVMLIGDVNQLAPVGYGAPLRDLIAAGMPYGELSEIQRNSGRIVKCCHGIIDKHRFEPSPKLDLGAESPENLLHVERRDPEQQIEVVKSMLEKFRRGATVLPGILVGAVWDCQIVVPVNNKSPLARIKLNIMLQNFLNPGGERVAGSPFRVGDKIVNGKNGWLPAETNLPRGLPGGPWNTEQREGKVYSANGEQAAVLAVFPRYTVSRLWAPDRIVRIPKGDSYTNEDGEQEDTGCAWDLAYALSVHKSQGSQWPVVITLADSYAGARMLCDRCWLYTALSRAESMAVTVGQRDVLDGMCQKSHIWQRKTFLRETIGELSRMTTVRGWEELVSWWNEQTITL